MNKVRRKFVLWAAAAIFILLAILLSVINGISFTMAANDADRLTQSIADEGGGLFTDNMNDPQQGYPGAQNGRFGPMGPDSPEMKFSVRYFTVRIIGGIAQVTQFRISAISEQDAADWAMKLSKGTTGWTRGTYRYRVYEKDGNTCVIVIDQGRELLASYRILAISVIGGLLLTAISFIILVFVGKRLFHPLEDADRKQKQFIREAENEFKLPLTVISANTELIERRAGSSAQTDSINRQVRKMTALVRKLSTLSIYEDENDVSAVSLSDLLSAAIDAEKERYESRGIRLETNIAPDVTVNGSAEALRGVCEQLVDNSLKFSVSRALFTLSREGGRITLCASNDARLPDGTADQVFDRFTRLSNANGVEGDGLGLSFVKDAVKVHDGRVEAKVSNGEFCVRILL
ncbi:MAG: HAMP domain-containing histidine kinase [Clostridia bacterium]|nr:HAMP domain-containing histidine kinase [Clostridia bacterium]